MQFSAPGPEQVDLQATLHAGRKKVKMTDGSDHCQKSLVASHHQLHKIYVPLQMYFPGVFSQYVPSLHREESSWHSFLSGGGSDIITV